MDWEKIVSLVQLALSQLWSAVAVAFLVYQAGYVSKRAAGRLGWRGTAEHPSWYDITLRVHPFVGGLLLGLVPFPALSAIDDIAPGSWAPAEVVARAGWFMLWGGWCGQVYETVTFALWAVRRRAAIASGARPSSIDAPPRKDDSDPPPASEDEKS